jgi:transcription initiation factor TFIIH subunit 1
MTIRSSNLPDLQATPASNPKVMIKVFVSQNPAQDAVASVFNFTSPNARSDCDSITEAIKAAIAERNKPKTVAEVLREGEEGLLRNTDLQMGLLKQDVELSRTFRALVIEGQLSSEQFWRARVVYSLYCQKGLCLAFTTSACN